KDVAADVHGRPGDALADGLEAAAVHVDGADHDLQRLAGVTPARDAALAGLQFGHDAVAQQPAASRLVDVVAIGGGGYQEGGSLRGEGVGVAAVPALQVGAAAPGAVAHLQAVDGDPLAIEDELALDAPELVDVGRPGHPRR